MAHCLHPALVLQQMHGPGDLVFAGSQAEIRFSKFAGWLDPVICRTLHLSNGRSLSLAYQA